MLSDQILWQERDSFLLHASRFIETVDVVLDVGCGIVPMNYFRPAVHIMIEPYYEYSNILVRRYADDKSVFVFSGTAQEMLPRFGDNSVDSIFFLDVIEHCEKEVGFNLLREAERIARTQVIVFTPLGYMPQHVGHDETDAWGLHGANFQKHLSGWLPEDFGDTWQFCICESYHQQDFRQNDLPEPYGAMFAIKNIDSKPVFSECKMVNIQRPLPSELQLQKTEMTLAATQEELQRTASILAATQEELQRTASILAATQDQLSQALGFLNHPFIRYQRRIAKFLRAFRGSRG